MDRRSFLSFFAGSSVGATLFPGVLWSTIASAQTDEITTDMIAAAEKIAGLEFTEEEREAMASGLRRLPSNFEAIRQVPLPNDTPPAYQFNPLLPGQELDTNQRPIHWTEHAVPDIPNNLEEIAFWSVGKLAAAIKARKLTSVDLTEMYLARLKRFDPTLLCVVTLTEERAREQARRADAEIAAGRYRGPLHGIPWGAKDLLATKGVPTTWGAKPYEKQLIDGDATVVKKLDEAGAVLVAKLTLGALAQGDVWFGGRTRNPWHTRSGSSGSSAGPASAVAAGLVGFAIGSETNGSIASPSTVCGVTGLRPTFGRVSRHGAMALSWTMDKLGPMARTAEDCALVLDAIRGADGEDPTAVDAAFNYDSSANISRLKVGYLRGAFDAEDDKRTLDEVRSLGVDPVPIDLPDLPFNDMGFILMVEAAAAFDELTRSNRDDDLVNQARGAWPTTFRRARMVPAVEYVQANRVRTLLMREMAKIFEQVDVYVTPAVQNLYLTNFTGHPLITLPNGFNERGLPTSTGFVGGLYDEARVCAIAAAYQRATEYHEKHPELTR